MLLMLRYGLSQVTFDVLLILLYVYWLSQVTSDMLLMLRHHWQCLGSYEKEYPCQFQLQVAPNWN